MTDLDVMLCVAVVALALALSVALLSMPLLIWQVLRQANDISHLKEQTNRLLGVDEALRQDLDKVDAVLDGMLSAGRTLE